jgi:hypothetical protein
MITKRHQFTTSFKPGDTVTINSDYWMDQGQWTVKSAIIYEGGRIVYNLSGYGHSATSTVEESYLTLVQSKEEVV